jgi:hypothetical protein
VRPRMRISARVTMARSWAVDAALARQFQRLMRM